MFKLIMPTYEYECKTCSHNFEIFQNMSDPPIKECPKCGKEVRRLIFGGTGVIFKGSGFYITDKAKQTAGKSKTSPDKAACAGCPAASESGQCPAADGSSGAASSGAASSGAQTESKTA